MPSLQNRYHTSRLFSMASAATEIQVVAIAGEVVLDVQVSGFDVTGAKHPQHATAILKIEDAIRFETLLDEAITTALGVTEEDPRQGTLPAIWSDATHTQPVRRRAA